MRYWLPWFAWEPSSSSEVPGLETIMNLKHFNLSKCLRTPLLSLLLLSLVGCMHEAGGLTNDTPVFDFRPSDIANATAETIDPGHIDTQEGAPHYEAELRLLLNDDGVRRFQRFNQSHDGQSFEVRVNGEVLLTGIGANGQRGAVRDLSWFVASMEEASQFAASLNRK